MNGKKLVISMGVIVAIGLGIYFANYKKPENTNNNQNATTTPNTNTPEVVGIGYKNTEYGFIMQLPDSWKDFSVVEDSWEGDSVDASGNFQEGTEAGPLISIRHPDWEYKSPRQDIPIMVFTIEKWNNMLAEKFHIGAAPINPSEIGRNKLYVFAIPARYNFSYLTGYEEVDQIIRGGNFRTF